MIRKMFLILYYGIAYYLPDSYVPLVGKISNAFRVICCRHIFKKCGNISTVNRKAYFGKGTNIEIGDYSGLGANCRIPDNIIIGNYVMMAPDVLIFKQNHNISRVDIPMGKQGVSESRPVVIGNDVWLGQRAMIMPGRKIADGTVIAAGAVVSKDHPKYTIVGGNPGRVLRQRQ